MTGTVDLQGRALLPVRIVDSTGVVRAAWDGWIDTGFTGDFVVPRRLLAGLGLQISYTVPAVLADGSQITLETYSCLLEWSGLFRAVEVIANDGEFPLIGVALLRDYQLHINYPGRTVTLT